jgi:hypothetical protein
MDDGSARRKAATYTKTTWKRNKRKQTSMSWVEFEPTILVFEGTKIVYALDRAASVIGFVNTTTTAKLLHSSVWIRI